MVTRFMRMVRAMVRTASIHWKGAVLKALAPGVFAFAVALGLPARAFADAGAPRPNIIFILADDMGYGDAGFMGQRWIATPHIDRLAREGVVFTHHYAVAPMCTPSRCGLMTGMHNGHCTLPNNGPSDETLRPEDVTVAEVLREAGYATHFIGKWGLGGATPSPDFDGTGELIPDARHGLPTQKGFDTSYGFLDQLTAHKYFPRYIWRNESKERIPGNNTENYNERTVYIHDLFTKEALDIVQSADGSKPFYLQLSYTLPHRETKFPGSPLPADQAGSESYNPYPEDHWVGLEPAPTPADKAYAAMIAYMDRDIGRLLDAVDGNPAIAGNTLFVFSSDNGPQFTDGHAAEMFNSSGGLRGKKFFLYEGGIREPFAARWKGVIEPDRTSGHVSYFADFLPTAAELAGAPVPTGIDGISYGPTLTGQGRQREHDYLVFTQPGATDRPVQAVRKKRDNQGRIWKLLVMPDGSVELYDLASDPVESKNVALEHPDTVAELKGVLERECTGPKPTA